MGWYWWVLILVIAIVILVSIFGNRPRRYTNQERDVFRRQVLGSAYRTPEQHAAEEAAQLRAVSLVLDLPVLPSAAAGTIQTRNQVSGNIRTMLEAPHVRTQVVKAPHKIIFVQELPGRSGNAVVREYARTAADAWSVITRHAENFDMAIAEVEADDTVDVRECGNCGHFNRIIIAAAYQPWTCEQCGNPLQPD